LGWVYLNLPLLKKEKEERKKERGYLFEKWES